MPGRLRDDWDLFSEETLKVLVVSEKAFEVKQLKEMLSDLPYADFEVRLEFYSTDSGKAGAEQIEAAVKTEKPFDLLIIQHKMKKMSGIQTVNSIDSKKLCPSILIVESMDKMITDEGAKTGFSGYLEMPVKIENLKKIITDTAEKLATHEMHGLTAEKQMLNLASDSGGSMDSDSAEAIKELNGRIANKMQRAFLMAPWSKDIAGAMIGIYMELARYAEAIPLLKGFIKNNFGDKESHRLLAECYKRLGKSMEDLPMLEQMIKDNPESSEAHYKIASYYMREGEIDKAVEHYKLAASFHKEGDGSKLKADSLSGLGAAYIADGEKTGDKSKFSEAFDELKNAINADPSVNASYFRMAEALKKLDKEKEANAVLEVALKKEPTTPADWLEWFFFNLLKGEKEKAKDALNHAMEGDPENQITLCLAGEAYFRQAMYDEAVALFEKAVEINPSDIRLYNWLGICYRRLTQLPKALERYEKALEIDPEDFNVHFNVGRVHTLKNDFKEAREAFESALKFNPDLGEAKTALDQLPKVI